MSFYEFVYVTRQDLTTSDVDNLTEKFRKIIEENKGKLISKEYWGLRTLAYKINKNTKGHYVLMNIEAPHSVLLELERVVNLDESIIRNGVFKINKVSNEHSKLFVSVNAKDKK